MAETNKGERLVQTFCAMCGPSMGCGLNCYVKDGKLVRVEGMKDAPNSWGKLCSRAFASIQWLYSPQRLKYPLKRVGKKVSPGRPTRTVSPSFWSCSGSTPQRVKA